MKTNIPMLDLKRQYEYMKESIDRALERCLDHQRWIFGPEVKEFEERAGEYLGVEHAVGVSSGTEALVLSLRALAIRTKGKEYFDSDDEILAPAFTFTATGDAILRAGATPVFVDVNPGTGNIDASQMEACLVSAGGDRVVGVVPVHLYGQACDMDRIMSISGERGLFAVEDVAQAFGGALGGRRLGSIGTAGAFSFFPSKNLGGFGDGGMVATNDEELADLVRMLLRHGGKDKYNVDHIGYNARLDTLQAAVLLAKFSFIDEFNSRRGAIAAEYDRSLAGLDPDFLFLPKAAPAEKVRHVYHQYTVRVRGGKRDGLMKFLKECGVSTMIYYPLPLHHMKVFEGRARSFGSLCACEALCREVLSLPMEPLQKAEETERIISSVRSFFRK